MNAVTPFRPSHLVHVPEPELVEAVARTPLDHYLVWNGRPRVGRPNSVLTQALACIDEIWTPVSMRILLRRAARLAGQMGLAPEAVRKAVWSHQSATPSCYYLVRATPQGAYLAVTDIPRPSSWTGPLRPGDFVMDAERRLDAPPAQRRA